MMPQSQNATIQAPNFGFHRNRDPGENSTTPTAIMKPTDRSRSIPGAL
jgi:hypothetical protein